MKSLELKIPPPVVLLLVGGAMWWVAKSVPLVAVAASVRIGVAVAIALIGVAFAVSGVISLRRAGTTVNPIKPESSTSLVRSGIYKVTRNPMYVGLTCLLVAWAVFLSSAWALLGPLLFVLYITRFQIVPEERVLTTLFGAEYEAYKSTVRRWL